MITLEQCDWSHERYGRCQIQKGHPGRHKVNPPAQPAHTCHARNCTVAVPPEMLMCLMHWRMVPKAIRERVWATYKPGQCQGNPSPSAEWHQAADDAIQAVYEKELQKA